MKNIRGIAATVIAIVALLLGYNLKVGDTPSTPVGDAGPGVAAPRAPASDAGHAAAADRIVAAFEAGQGDLWVETSGTVQRVLSDDSEGSRHQRIIVRLANDHTILIAHNIDLAQRVPVRQGDTVAFYGEYEWNDRGGVVHWTHHDPRNRREGGWIEHDGTTYR